MTQSNQLIGGMSKEERLMLALDLRAAGVPLTDIGKQIGYSRTWTCRILKAAGAPLPKVMVDKRGSPRTKHGMRKHPTYYTWYSMKTRCGNPNHADYPHWGGRGIIYDPRWECFLDFLEDMGPRPGREYTLERKDNDGNYCKANCVWALKIHQTRNQRNTILCIEKAREMRAEYAAGGVSYKGLAKKHGVASSLIGGIIKGRVWKEAA